MRWKRNQLQLEGSSVRFGGVEALTAVDLELAPGQVLGLVGANGCGKNTMRHFDEAGSGPPRRKAGAPRGGQKQ